MSHFWFIFSLRWSLQDVQAVFSFLISALSAVAIFTFARFCWLNATLHLTKQRDVPVASLLSLTTPGEAFQVLRFLNFRGLTSRRYRRILFQSLVIFGLSVTAMLSGPIARFASRRGIAIRPVEMRGSLASTDWDSMIEADTIWNQTLSSLTAAKFPLDQLLDFLPDPGVTWVYNEKEWNNTWRANCTFDPVKPLYGLETTGNYSTDWFVEIPGLEQTVPDRFLEENVSWRENEGSWWSHGIVHDFLLFNSILIQPKTGSDSVEDVYMGLLISAIHLHDIPKAPSGNDAFFGKGHVGKASYTRAICDLTRSASTIKTTDIADPNFWYPKDDAFSAAIEEHYHNSFMSQSHTVGGAQLPTGEDMFRFYQAYLISKDTQDYHPVTRIISAQVPTVELSSVFLAVIILAGFLVLTGLIHHSFFLVRHGSAINQMPESKLDWLLQSLREAERINASNAVGNYKSTPDRPSPLDHRQSSATSPKPRTTFDSATYRWQNTLHDDGRKTTGTVVLEKEVELTTPTQVFQQSQSPPVRPQLLQPFGSSSSSIPSSSPLHLGGCGGDVASLLSQPGRTGWHYCSGHGEDCADRIERESFV